MWRWRGFWLGQFTRDGGYMEYKDSIHKVNKSKVVDNVIEQMQALIDRGIWKEGDKIASEAQMSVDFNVSRVVIREALQYFRGKNMIITKHGLGSFICNPNNFNTVPGMEPMKITFEDIQNLKELRKCIEIGAVELAGKRATSEDLEKIRRAFEQMKASEEDMEEFTKADLEFHMAIVESAHNKLLYKAYRSCGNEIYHILRNMNSIQDARTYAISTHEKICNAMMERKPKEAIDVLNNSMQYNDARYSKYF